MTTYPKTKCAGCGRYFTGDRGFDLHLTGGYGPKSPPRRCKTVEELEESGFEIVRGIVTDLDGRKERDVWGIPPSENDRARLAALKQK